MKRLLLSKYACSSYCLKSLPHLKLRELWYPRATKCTLCLFQNRHQKRACWLPVPCHVACPSQTKVPNGMIEKEIRANWKKCTADREPTRQGDFPEMSRRWNAGDINNQDIIFSIISISSAACCWRTKVRMKKGFQMGKHERTTEQFTRKEYEALNTSVFWLDP